MPRSCIAVHRAVNEMNPNKQPNPDRFFFAAILLTLIGCTLFSGGTAIVLATEMLSETTINVAQNP